MIYWPAKMVCCRCRWEFIQPTKKWRVLLWRRDTFRGINS